MSQYERVSTVLEFVALLTSVSATLLAFGLAAGLYMMAGWSLWFAWAINHKGKPNAI